MDMYPLKLQRRSHVLDGAMLREWRRAYGGADRFNRIIAFAGASLRDIIWASIADGEKILLVDHETMSHAALIPQWVLDRFSVVCGPANATDLISRLSSFAEYRQVEKISSLASVLS